MKKRKKEKNSCPFSQKHPKLNFLLALSILLTMFIGGGYFIYFAVCFLGKGITKIAQYLTHLTSKMDAVVVVALITAAVSLVSVIISSVVAKIIDYRKSRQEYLAQKREKPYGEFVDMVYKIQQTTKNPGSYNEKEMIEDISKFSREITLWGSDKVVKKWVKFRENGTKPDAGQDNLFIMEDIMNAMRKDLGLKRVKKGNLLAFFINDIKTVMKARNK